MGRLREHGSTLPPSLPDPALFAVLAARLRTTGLGALLQPAARDQELHGPCPCHIIQVSEDDALLPLRWLSKLKNATSPAFLPVGLLSE